jgi:hypothetical protein
MPGGIENVFRIVRAMHKTFKRDVEEVDMDRLIGIAKLIGRLSMVIKESAEKVFPRFIEQLEEEKRALQAELKSKFRHPSGSFDELQDLIDEALAD